MFFTDAIIDIENRNFNAKDIKLSLHKDIFDNSENDPRLKGVSSTESLTILRNKEYSLVAKKEMAVLLGQYKQKKLNMIKQKSSLYTITHY